MYLIFKRLVDLLFSIVFLIILTPLFIPIMVGLKLTGEGYIWYKQKRVGYKNRQFLIWKFATMLKDSPNMEGGIITTKKDPRITPMGGFLRKTKINELPQFINVLTGHMSLVGPRPVMPISFETYQKEIQDIIFNVKPGLTGIGSIMFRDEEDLLDRVRKEGLDTWEFYSKKIYPLKGEVEKWYQKNRSFTTDIKIIFITLWVVIRPESQIIYHIFKDLPVRNF